jgi:hypothetical protein
MSDPNTSSTTLGPSATPSASLVVLPKCTSTRHPRQKCHILGGLVPDPTSGGVWTTGSVCNPDPSATQVVWQVGKEHNRHWCMLGNTNYQSTIGDCHHQV